MAECANWVTPWRAAPTARAQLCQLLAARPARRAVFAQLSGVVVCPAGLDPASKW
jgi:hypothetical protein